ncbi:MAG: hypothetical protein JWM31_3410 [Solirubrobacterales bacterium]|nr:hypothetical protein [Solirubrobacterales bacterium]
MPATERPRSTTSPAIDDSGYGEQPGPVRVTLTPPGEERLQTLCRLHSHWLTERGQSIGEVWGAFGEGPR